MGPAGVGVLIVAAGAIFLAQPWWYRRRKHLTEVTAAGAGDLVNRLEQVRQRAGAGPVVWLLQPLDARLSAFAFGRPRCRFVVISGGAAVAAVRKPAAFDAVVLHELAHIKNRDIDQTYLALAIWRAFVVAALLPLAVLLILSGARGEPQQQIWRVAVMALIVYALRNAILRAREFDADARVRQLDPETALGAVLADLPARTGRRARSLGWRHPSGQERAAALRDPAPLYRFGFWDGLAIGLVTALGASAAQKIVILLSTTAGVRALFRPSSSQPWRDPRWRWWCGDGGCWRGARTRRRDGPPGWAWDSAWRSARSWLCRRCTTRRCCRIIRAWPPSTPWRYGPASWC